MSACDRCQPIGSYRRRNTTSRRGRNGITISCCGDKGLILPWHSFRKGNHVLTYRIRDTGSRPDNLNGKFVWIVGAVESYLGGSRLESEPCYRLFRSNFYFLHFHVKFLKRTQIPLIFVTCRSWTLKLTILSFRDFFALIVQME